MQSFPLPTGSTRIRTGEGYDELALPHVMTHRKAENRPDTPRPLPVHTADFTYDSSQTNGFVATSRFAIFVGVHCHGFSLSTADADVAATSATSPMTTRATAAPLRRRSTRVDRRGLMGNPTLSAIWPLRAETTSL